MAAPTAAQQVPWECLPDPRPFKEAGRYMLHVQALVRGQPRCVVHVALSLPSKDQCKGLVSFTAPGLHTLLHNTFGVPKASLSRRASRFTVKMAARFAVGGVGLVEDVSSGLMWLADLATGRRPVGVAMPAWAPPRLALPLGETCG